MRQVQKNNQRQKGRNGRKSSNPLSKIYDSNGPEVKIKGTAQQVADKYISLARDVSSSGDRVMAESLLQHAEHYLRIIAAATPNHPREDRASSQNQSRVNGSNRRNSDQNQKSENDVSNTDIHENELNNEINDITQNGSPPEISQLDSTDKSGQNTETVDETSNETSIADNTSDETASAKPKRTRSTKTPRKSTKTKTITEENSENDEASKAPPKRKRRTKATQIEAVGDELDASNDADLSNENDASKDESSSSVKTTRSRASVKTPRKSSSKSKNTEEESREPQHVEASIDETNAISA